METVPQRILAIVTILTLVLNVMFKVVVVSLQMIQEFAHLTEIVHHQMYVNVIQGLMEIFVKMQFVSTSLIVIQRFAQIDKEIVLHQILVTVPSNGLEFNVKFQNVMEEMLPILWSALAEVHVLLLMFAQLVLLVLEVQDVKHQFVLDSLQITPLKFVPVKDLVFRLMFVHLVMLDGLDQCVKMQFVMERLQMIQQTSALVVDRA